MKTLLARSVEPASEGEQALEADRIADFLAVLGHDWQCIDNHHLVKTFEFDDFLEALDFVNQVGQYAEEVNHHPTITFTWGEATIEIYTHDVDGLREDDFVWAANVEQIYEISLASDK